MVRRRACAVSNHVDRPWPRPSRRGQRVRAKRGPMINSDAAPQDEGPSYCALPRIKKAGQSPPFSETTWVPGQNARRSTRADRLLLGLLRFLGLLRLLGLLRFLSHSILSRFNGLNATPRH